MTTQSSTQLAHFQVSMTIIDKPTDRRRWNGDPMASGEATAALSEAVEAFKAVIVAHGFAVARTGYGALASHLCPSSGAACPCLPGSTSEAYCRAQVELAEERR